MTDILNTNRGMIDKLKDAIKGYSNKYNEQINLLNGQINQKDNIINELITENENKEIQITRFKEEIEIKKSKLIKIADDIAYEQIINKNLTQNICDLENNNMQYKQIFGEISIEKSKSSSVSPFDIDSNIFDVLVKNNKGKSFNSEQIEAIRYNMDKNLRIIAGAGSGKTQTICAKAAYISLTKMAKEKEIIMCTFTRKAKEELKERVNKFLGENYVGVYTFHGWFGNEYKQLKNDFDSVNSIGIQGKVEEDDYKRIFNGLIADHRLEKLDEEGDKRLIDKVSYWMNMGYSNDDIISFIRIYYDDLIPNEQSKLSDRFKEFLFSLEEEKIKNEIISYDDCLLNLYEVLTNQPHILEHVQKKYKYVFIDEFQDINPLQMNIIKLICPPDYGVNANNTKLIIVGDDDQSIYYFRGAEPKYIKNFDNEYETYSLKLMTNYRSMSNIVQAGNCIINYNKDRIQKTMISNEKLNGECYIVKADNIANEANWIIDKAIKLGLQDSEDKINPNFYNNVILCPGILQIETMVQVLVQRNIPFVVIAEIDLLGIFKIKDFMKFYKAWKNFDNNSELYNYQEIIRILCNSFFIKNNEFNEYKSHGKFDDISIIAFIKDKYKQADEKLIKNYLTEVRNLKSEIINFENFTKLFEQLPTIKRNLTTDQIDCIKNELLLHKNWEELNNSYERTKDIQKNKKKLLKDYSDKKYNAICIMTIHKSKGLGFEHVFVKGIYKDSLPNYRVKDLDEEELNILIEKAEPATTMEEQRRLMYVAITRAKKNLYITLPKEINNKATLMSQFLQESNIPVLKDDNLVRSSLK